MKAKLITSPQIARELGPPLSIRYYLLEEASGSGKLYGIKVVEETIRAAAVAPGLTGDKQYAFELIDRLAKGSVIPAGLADVLADLL
ncbi:MAG: DUF6514 family protein [Dysosmobacter sp.]|nr:DUF6514 family protein [Dysosmobacter sp.]